MSEMKLTYFNGRGRAEMTRLLFKLAGKSFIDNRVAGEEWTKFKPNTPKGQLPVLEVDGKMMCESMAIARFVARETGLYGSNNWEAAVCDMIADTCDVIILSLIELKFKAKTDEQIAEAKKKVQDNAATLEKFVTPLKKGTFVLGENASLADVLIHSSFQGFKTIYPDFDSANMATVCAIDKSFSEIPAIAEWLKSRPETSF